MTATVNVLREIELVLPKLGNAWAIDYEAHTRHMAIKGSNLASLFVEYFYRDDGRYPTKALRTPDGDVVFAVTLLGNRFVVDVREDETGGGVVVLYSLHGTPTLLKKVALEWVNIVAGRIVNNSINTSMVAIQDGRLWSCDTMDELLPALMAIAADPQYKHLRAGELTENESETGYVMVHTADPFTGRPLYSIETKEEYVRRILPDLKRRVSELNKIIPGSFTL